MNMSYCRFENTFHDLQDCYDNMEDTDLGKTETTKREQLVELCREIVNDFGDTDFDDLTDDEEVCDGCERLLFACNCQEVK